jgi:DNA-binding NtrC family response regulator
MNHLQCRNCELIQPLAMYCRRCGRSLASVSRLTPEQIAQPKPVIDQTKPVVERKVSIIELNLPFSEIERIVILARIEQCDGDTIKAARSLGIGRTTIYRKLQHYRRCNGTQNGTENT